MAIRLIDAGTVSGLRSQSIYHGLARSLGKEEDDIIVLVRPSDKYMCIGFFQDVQQQLDITYCRNNNIQIIRRETGGGTVLIDGGQLFIQWIFHPDNLPSRVDQRFEMFIKPLIDTHKFFGINAYFHPINDVHVDGKKIVGTGAGHIGNAEVVTGNFLFDFDYHTMCDALQLPEGMKDSVYDTMHESLTTIHREKSEVSDHELWKNQYVEQCKTLFDVPIYISDLTIEEKNQISEIEKMFLSEDWMFQYKKPLMEERIVKIHNNLWVAQQPIPDESYIGQMNVRFSASQILNVSFDIAQRTVEVANLERALKGRLLETLSIQQAVVKSILPGGKVEYDYRISQWVHAFMELHRVKPL